MFPFIDLKITKIPLYGLCIAFGILVASLIAYFVTKKKGIAFAYFIIVETCCYAFAECEMIFALSVSQFISIVLFAVSVAQVVVFFGLSKTSKTSSENTGGDKIALSK